LYGRTAIPTIIEHMIENEEVDDIGEGSGKRYIIKDHQIINLSMEEKPPDFTVIEATGLFGEGLPKKVNSLSAGSGGNAMTTAWATDYDMWKMYGFKALQPRSFPFLSNPDTQLAPMAVWMLNNERRKIFQGSLTIVGNEYMQPGEVIYIEDRDMLFYVESVNHSINYSGDFQTQMRLSYGHNPGEYIPTMLDIVGKSLYSKKHQANLVRHARHGHSDGSTPLNVLVSDGWASLDIKGLMSGVYGNDNRKNLTNLLFQVNNVITPGLDKKLVIEFRIYYNSQKGVVAPNTSLQSSAAGAISWLKDPVQYSQNSDTVLPDDLPDGVGLANSENIELVVKEVDLGATGSTVEDSSKRDIPVRSPSSHAWHMARALNDKTPVSGSANPAGNLAGTLLPEARVLFTNIIDIWSRFDTVEATDDTNNSFTIATLQRSQALQKAQQQIIATFYKKGERTEGTTASRLEASLTDRVNAALDEEES